MPSFTDQLEALNQVAIDTFAKTADSTITYTQGLVSITLESIPIDPLRLEIAAPGNFTVRWVKLNELTGHSPTPITPRRGDIVTINSVNYFVNQIQVDEGGGVRLILDKKAA